MTTPTPFIPAKRRVRRKRRVRNASAAPLPGAPVLIAAAYLASAWVRLTFDRPVSAPGAIPLDHLFVNDGPMTGLVWAGDAVTALGLSRVQVSLVEFEPSGGAVTTLTATALTGIVSAFDGTPWAGVSDVALPFP